MNKKELLIKDLDAIRQMAEDLSQMEDVAQQKSALKLHSLLNQIEEIIELNLL